MLSVSVVVIVIVISVIIVVFVIIDNYSISVRWILVSYDHRISHEWNTCFIKNVPKYEELN